MSLRFHEIAEADHRILNPFSDEKLRLVGELCDLGDGMRVLDLCCGKAEMLCTWAHQSGIVGVGVDISEPFLAAARQRAVELGVSDRVELLRADAANHARGVGETFDLVSCIGATWIGGGLAGTLELIRPCVDPSGIVAVGEPYWIDPLPSGTVVAGVQESDFASLVGTLDRFEDAGFELVEMVLADHDDWDRYVASQWKTVNMWLREHGDDPDADELRRWIRDGQRSYLSVDRRYLGWGVFILRPSPPT
jgi:SAM-dependent methyltransferase